VKQKRARNYYKIKKKEQQGKMADEKILQCDCEWKSQGNRRASGITKVLTVQLKSMEKHKGNEVLATTDAQDKLTLPTSLKHSAGMWCDSDSSCIPYGVVVVLPSSLPRDQG
jgi:hypothetical protein